MEVVFWCAIYGNYSFIQLKGFKTQRQKISQIPVLTILSNIDCLKYKGWLVCFGLFNRLRENYFKKEMKYLKSVP